MPPLTAMRGTWFLLAALVARPAAAAVVRSAYLQMAAPTAMSVRWRTDVSETGRVNWGSAPGSLSSFLDQSTSASTEHELRLTGLSPSTTYYYSIGTPSLTHAGADADHRFKTPPLTGTAGAYRVWVLGDAGRGSVGQAAVRDAFAALTGSSGIEADLWLQLGDNAYQNGTDAEYQAKNFDVYAQLYRQSCLFPCIGNHEGDGSAGYYPSFSLPTQGEIGGVPSGTEAYYSFNFGNIHFVSLDSYNSSRAVGGAQYAWLDSDLQANAQPWTVVYFHHPPYSKGSHDSDNEIELMEMRQNFNALLESHGVDLVLAGHSHAYERSRFIDGHYGVSGTFNEAPYYAGGMLRQGGFGRPAVDGAYHKYPGAHTGTLYLVNGTGGQADSGALNHPAHAVSLSALGSLVLDFNGGTLNAVFLDSAAATRDNFSIIKAVGTPTPGPPWVPTPALRLAEGHSVELSPSVIRRGQSTCALAAFETVLGLEVFNVSGQRVVAAGQACVDSSGWAAGLYYARIELKAADGGRRYTLRKLAVLP